MVRAAVSGAVDFTRCDPRDSQWWRKLYWIVDELGKSERREIARVRSSHWATLFTNAKLGKEGFETTLTAATDSLEEYVRLALPWASEKVKTTGGSGGVKDLMAEWRETWGNPGDPQYEEMMEYNRQLFEQDEESETRRQRRLAREQGARDGLHTTA